MSFSCSCIDAYLYFFLLCYHKSDHWRTQMLNAVLVLIPNSSQRLSNCIFKSESNLIVRTDCALILSVFNKGSKMIAMCN